MKISRRDLFDKVWSMPMTKLAAEMDISDVGLAKACRRSAIPLPKAGHWIKAQHGKAEPKPALPEFDKEFVEIDASRNRSKKLERVLVLKEFPEAKGLIVERTADLGEYAEALQVALSKTKPDANGFMRCGASNVIRCEISAMSTARVVAIINAIEMNLSKVGGRLVRDREKKVIRIEVEDQRIGFCILEGYKRTEHIQKHEKYEWMNQRSYSYSFNGLLRIQLEAECRGRKAWSDGVRVRLEDKFGDFLLGLVDVARRVVQLRDERETQRLHWVEVQKRYEKEAEFKRQAEFFKMSLIKEAEAWRDAQTVKAYLLHLRGVLAEKSNLANSNGMKWLRQAEYVVDHIDPSKIRIERLHQGMEVDDYYGLFGKPLA
jgi:hypothetical protein